jgi:hypothetical protein
VFVEGWRVDENQLLFHNIDHFRSVSVLYLGGANCLGGYPLFDFSRDEYFDKSLALLVRHLERGTSRTVDQPPIQSGRPDPSVHVWRDSGIWSAKLWRNSGEETLVLRPSLTPDGGHAGLFNIFKDWTPF